MPAVVLTFLRAHWRPLAVVGVAVALFAAGRFTAPRPTITVHTEWKDRVVTQVAEKKVEQKAETKQIVVYRDHVVRKDGTVEDKTETHETDGVQDNTTTDTHTSTVATSEGSQTTTITPATHAPNWFVSASLGVPVSLRAPFTGTPFVIVDVSRRVLGPISLGVWGSLDISGRNPALGLSVGVSF